MKRFLVWVIRSFILAIILPGLVNAFSGHYLYFLMRFVVSPIIGYVHIMPADSHSFDGAKWLYTACTLFVEFTFITGIILMIAELRGKPRLSNPSIRFIAHLLAAMEISIQKAWNLSQHECDFYWLVATKGEDYEYFTSDRHLTDEDKQVIQRTFLLNRDLRAETSLRTDFPRHPAYEYVFIRNSGKFQIGIMVFINKQGVLNTTTMGAFQEIVEPIVSLDGTKEIMVELTKKRGEIVV